MSYSLEAPVYIKHSIVFQERHSKVDTPNESELYQPTNEMYIPPSILPSCKTVCWHTWSSSTRCIEIEWIKTIGDHISIFATLCRVKTDKQTYTQVRAPRKGVLAKILVPSGKVDISIGSPLCILMPEDINNTNFGNNCLTSEVKPEAKEKFELMVNLQKSSKSEIFTDSIRKSKSKPLKNYLRWNAQLCFARKKGQKIWPTPNFSYNDEGIGFILETYLVDNSENANSMLKGLNQTWNDEFTTYSANSQVIDVFAPKKEGTKPVYNKNLSFDRGM